MAITITEQITRNLHVELGAEHIHALVTEAALREAGLSAADNVSVTFDALPALVSISQRIEGIGTNPNTANGKAAKEVRTEITPKAKSAPLMNPWTAEEDDTALRIMAANHALKSDALVQLIAAALPERPIGGIAFRIRTKLKERVSAQAAPAAERDTPAPTRAATSATAPVASASPVSVLNEAALAAMPPHLRAHLKGLPRLDGWSSTDDVELMRRVVACENTAIIAAAMEREAGFVVRRVDQLLGRKKGGQVSFNRGAIAKALADAVGTPMKGEA